MTTKPRHPTLSEVARKAGVGTTTASRVINGGQHVDPKTYARVQRAVESLGYVPNHAARILKGARTRTIGLVIPSIADPFFASCAEAAEAIAHLHDSLLVVLTTQNQSKAELDAVNLLLRHRVDGIIIAPSNVKDDALSALLRKVLVPVVAMDRPIASSSIPSIVTDNYAGAQLATKHLIEHGYKRIACITGEPHLYTMQERIRGFRDAMTAAGLEPVLYTDIKSRGDAEQAVRTWFSKRHAPEALLTLKNSTTIHFFDVLQRRAIAIPHTVALLGYDDFPLAELVRPSISVIRQPVDEIGHAAAKLLFERMLVSPDGAATAKPVSQAPVQLTTRLIRRDSCGCAPGAISLEDANPGQRVGRQFSKQLTPTAPRNNNS